MSGFVGSAHDAIGQLQSQVERLDESNERLLRALQEVVEARDDPDRLQVAIDTAEAEIALAQRKRR